MMAQVFGDKVKAGVARSARHLLPIAVVIAGAQSTVAQAQMEVAKHLGLYFQTENLCTSYGIMRNPVGNDAYRLTELQTKIKKRGMTAKSVAVLRKESETRRGLSVLNDFDLSRKGLHTNCSADFPVNPDVVDAFWQALQTSMRNASVAQADMTIEMTDETITLQRCARSPFEDDWKTLMDAKLTLVGADTESPIVEMRIQTQSSFFDPCQVQG